MSKKILIAGGCSYTDPNFTSLDTSLEENEKSGWPMWPEYLGNHLQLKTINTGLSGASNETILHRVMEQILIYNEKVDTVAVMWSASDRRRLFAKYNLNPISEAYTLSSESNNPLLWLNNIGLQDFSKNFFKSKYFYQVRSNFIKSAMEDSLRNYYMLADYCSKNKIKFIFVNALVPFHYDIFNILENSGFMQYPDNTKNINPEWVVHTFYNNLFFNRFDSEYKKHFLGWPIFADIGGGYVSQWLDEKPSPYFNKYANYRISKNDTHPNAMGQISVSKMIIEKYEELYE